MPRSAVELCQLEGCSAASHSHRGTEEWGTILVPALSRGARMGRELGDAGLSPFSISLSLELVALMPCSCPALGLGLVCAGLRLFPGWIPRCRRLSLIHI